MQQRRARHPMLLSKGDNMSHGNVNQVFSQHGPEINDCAKFPSPTDLQPKLMYNQAEAYRRKEITDTTFLRA